MPNGNSLSALSVKYNSPNSSFVGVILGAEPAFDKKDPEQIIRHGSFEDMDKLLGFENGADDYLTKPLHAFVVKETVHSIIENWDSRIE